MADSAPVEVQIEPRDAKGVKRAYEALMAARAESERATRAFNAVMGDLAADLSEEHEIPFSVETMNVDWERKVAIYKPKPVVEAPAEKGD